MTALKTQLFRAGLSALWYSGAARACERWTAGKGAILMLHRVQPRPAAMFAPNARLCISTEYLTKLLAAFRAAGVDVISLDEALLRVHTRKRTPRFVCFSFDDGYYDNLEHALPVFKRFHAPFTVYATTSFADRALAPWWCALEEVVANESEVHWVELDEGAHRAPTEASQLSSAKAGTEATYARGWRVGSDSGIGSGRDVASEPAVGSGAGSRVTVRFATRTVSEKQRAFAALSARFMALRASELRGQLRRFLTDHGRDMSALAAREMCSWSDLRTLQAAGVEIGCHGSSHARLSLESPETVFEELASAREELEAQLARPVRHLAYPYGKPEHAAAREFAIARDLGFTSAVTTRPGNLFSEHAEHLHALPRVEVTPSFAASPHYLQTILSGLPLAVRQRRRVVVTD